jgi:hypothetical protein
MLHASSSMPPLQHTRSHAIYCVETHKHLSDTSLLVGGCAARVSSCAGALPQSAGEADASPAKPGPKSADIIFSIVQRVIWGSDQTFRGASRARGCGRLRSRTGPALDGHCETLTWASNPLTKPYQLFGPPKLESQARTTAIGRYDRRDLRICAGVSAAWLAVWD